MLFRVKKASLHPIIMPAPPMKQVARDQAQWKKEMPTFRTNPKRAERYCWQS
jgi:hypothetical protein